MRSAATANTSRWFFSIRLLAHAVLWIAVAAAAGLALLAALHAAYAVIASLAVGAGIRWAGQRQHLASLRRSRQPAKLARFVFGRDRLHCEVDENRLRRYTQALEWRCAAAAAAGLLCWAMLHFRWFSGDLVPAFGSHFDRWNLLAASLLPVLPLYSALVFLGVAWPGQQWEPENRWARQAQAVIEARVAEANGAMGQQELDGLAPGVEMLWQALDLEQGTDYREAARLAFEQNVATAALHPEKLRRTLDVCTEMARQDLHHLREVLPEYGPAEQWLSIARTLSPLVRTHDLQLRTKELEKGFEALRLLAAERRWQELQRETASLSGKLADLCSDLRSELRFQSTAAPVGVLAPGTDPYRVLGISPGTPTPVIRKLRVSLAQIYHPDTSAATSSSSKMAEVNAAYDAVMKEREGR